MDKALFTSHILEWQTPPDLYKQLDDEFHFELDACTSPDNPLGTPRFYTEKDNGLNLPWYNPTYVNPPYGRAGKADKWIEKAYHSAQNGITVVMLLPSRTDTNWFHRWIYNKPNVEIRFLRGRLKFVGPKYTAPNGAPFPSMVVVFWGK